VVLVVLPGLTTANGSDNTNDYDYGGIALSTAQSIIVTSKVQEQLSSVFMLVLVAPKLTSY